MEALIKIQNELKAPKNQFNKFGNYKYRNQEDILEALKPLLLKHNCILTIRDEVRAIDNIIFIEATAKFTDGKQFIEVTAQAGIDVTTKGMSVAQCFGSSSSYARKYALNGLFLIDDTKDSDPANTHDDKPNVRKNEIVQMLGKCNTIEDLTVLWDSLEQNEMVEFKAIFGKRKSLLNAKN